MIKVALTAHPGQFIRKELVEPEGLTVTDTAALLGVTRPALSALLNCRASLSPEMALRIEKVFGLQMDTMLRMQAAYDAAQMRKREKEFKLKRYVA